MAGNRIGAQIENLIRRENWPSAQALLQKQLVKQPTDHWLWSRLSGVKYEQRDYKGALDAAEKSLAIIPDCPLALWSKAGVIELLGKADEAMEIYAHLFDRGIDQLQNPDEDTNECWEGPDWTSGLMADCACFGSRAAWRRPVRRDQAVEIYRNFLSLRAIWGFRASAHATMPWPG